MKSKVLTIYLPQFHAIPENDMWWGNGFTEWTNVQRGRSFYPGHYQPRVPYQNNYYDLSDLNVMERHIEIAQKAKIAGFAFYHYYFSGKKLLEKPIEDYRDYSQKDFPYCLIWANQSWARTWYRSDAGKQILLPQVYGGEEEWREHFDYLLKFFKDKRYIKIGNKPLYVIYLPQDITFRKRMFNLWNELAVQNGFDGIYLIAMNTGWGVDKLKYLYDAYMNFEPMHIMGEDVSYRKQLQRFKAEHIKDVNGGKSTFRNKIFAQNGFSYPYLCKQIEISSPQNGIKTFLGAFPGWDNTSRKDEAGLIVPRSTPKLFGRHIQKMLCTSEKMGNEYLFLNAWNEWSEGAYIEPDQKYGYAYLNELRKSILKYEKTKDILI